LYAKFDPKVPTSPRASSAAFEPSGARPRSPAMPSSQPRLLPSVSPAIVSI
jgi:hypothetical protein